MTEYLRHVADAEAANAVFEDALRTGHGPDTFAWRGHTLGKGPLDRWAGAARLQDRAAEIEASKVTRDSCPFCAVRADVGCRHRN